MGCRSGRADGVEYGSEGVNMCQGGARPSAMAEPRVYTKCNDTRRAKLNMIFYLFVAKHGHCTSNQRKNYRRTKTTNLLEWTSDRQPVPMDIFCCPVPPSRQELHLTDGVPYNYNCQSLPPAALKTIIKRLGLSSEAVIEAAKPASIQAVLLAWYFL